jgi:hypothetical protein
MSSLESGPPAMFSIENVYVNVQVDVKTEVDVDVDTDLGLNQKEAFALTPAFYLGAGAASLVTVLLGAILYYSGAFSAVAAALIKP